MARPDDCPLCHGDGEVLVNDWPWSHSQARWVMCPDCDGMGVKREVEEVGA